MSTTKDSHKFKELKFMTVLFFFWLINDPVVTLIWLDLCLDEFVP